MGIRLGETKAGQADDESKTEQRRDWMRSERKEQDGNTIKTRIREEEIRRLAKLEQERIREETMRKNRYEEEMETCPYPTNGDEDFFGFHRHPYFCRYLLIAVDNHAMRKDKLKFLRWSVAKEDEECLIV